MTRRTLLSRLLQAACVAIAAKVPAITGCVERYAPPSDDEIMRAYWIDRWGFDPDAPEEWHPYAFVTYQQWLALEEHFQAHRDLIEVDKQR